ncbi:MAG: cytochrome b [Acetobacteraceae bacterium]|nr:cytochrome b [Acetobacteraceae bacterium]
MSGLQQTYEAARPRSAGRKYRYDLLEITLHWATAVLVVALYSLAQIWSFFPEATQTELKSVHASLGLLLAVVLVCRIGWRAGPGRGVLPATTGLMELVSKLVHYMLYVLLVAVVGFGLCMRWAAHGEISFFDLLAVPSPFPVTDSLAHSLLPMHGWAASALIILAGLHACAALFHHFVLRDRVLRRMMP